MFFFFYKILTYCTFNMHFLWASSEWYCSEVMFLFDHFKIEKDIHHIADLKSTNQLDPQWRQASNSYRQTLRWVNKEPDATPSSSPTQCDETLGFLTTGQIVFVHKLKKYVTWIFIIRFKWNWSERHWSEESEARWQKERKTPASSAQLWITITRL